MRRAKDVQKGGRIVNIPEQCRVLFVPQGNNSHTGLVDTLQLITHKRFIRLLPCNVCGENPIDARDPGQFARAGPEDSGRILAVPVRATASVE